MSLASSHKWFNSYIAFNCNTANLFIYHYIYNNFILYILFIYLFIYLFLFFGFEIFIFSIMAYKMLLFVYQT
jgi:hypothetical protein